jgi:hypothetical protein
VKHDHKLARRLARLENRQRRDATRLLAEIRQLEVRLTPTDGLPVFYALKEPQSKSFGNGETMTPDDVLRRLG